MSDVGPDDDRPVQPGPVWLGPKASESELAEAPNGGRGLALRAVLPNAITAAALCSGLTGIRFAIVGDWEKALFAIILAGLLDGIDGRIARLLKGKVRLERRADFACDIRRRGNSILIPINAATRATRTLRQTFRAGASYGQGF